MHSIPVCVCVHLQTCVSCFRVHCLLVCSCSKNERNITFHWLSVLLLTARFFSISGIFHCSVLSHYFLLFWPILLLQDFPSFLATWWFDWLWPADSRMRSQISSGPPPLWWSNGRERRPLFETDPPFSAWRNFPSKAISVCILLVWFNRLLETGWITHTHGATDRCSHRPPSTTRSP